MPKPKKLKKTHFEKIEGLLNELEREEKIFVIDFYNQFNYGGKPLEM